jgi:hypothetical protein
MLAVIEHQEQFLVAQVRPKQIHRLGRSLVTQVECGHHRIGDQRWVPHIGQLHQPGAPGESSPEIGGDTDRQPSFAHATRTDQADQARGGQLPPGLGQLVMATDETSRLCRQVTESLGALGHIPKVLRRQ